jgi:histidine phosphotransferase ChpT
VRQNEPSLAALIGSRICHDLISPIGAISNGLELVEMAGTASSGPEMTLIRQSCDHATARIRFFRIAFGTASDIYPVSSSEADRTLANNYAHTRLSATWEIHHDQGRDIVQLAYLAILCLETALPQGGVLEVHRDGRTLMVTAQAEHTRADEPIWSLLSSEGEIDLTALRPADVQFALLAQMCRKAGITTQLSTSAGLATLSLTLPGPAM